MANAGGGGLGAVRLYRPGACTVGVDIDGPKAELTLVERELLGLEARIAREGGRVLAALFRVRDVSAVLSGPAFVRFARAYIDRTPGFSRVAVYTERSFVVRTIVDPIALLAPQLDIRTFSRLEPIAGWLKEVDATFLMPALGSPAESERGP
jgi:hypothetical protein